MKRTYKQIFFISILLISFLGIEAQTWYESAQERIDTLRKGDFSLEIKDELGNTYTDTVIIELKKHEFAWGNVVPIAGTRNSRWVRAVHDKYYNFGVVGNEFKWPWVEPTQGNPTYDVQNEVLDWVEKTDIGFRGHALIWGGDETWQMPAWTLDGSLTPGEIYEACSTHIMRDVDYWKDRIDEWDVVNEPSEGHERWLAETVGDSINWNSFKWAHEADSDAVLYINDYNILVWNSAEPYRNLIQTMLNNGAPVQGIGCQAHMEGSIDWTDVKTKLDYMGELGLPIRITEFDMKIDENQVSEQTMAAEYAEMMRTAFSHPAVNGFIFWTVWDGDAWRAGSGIYDEYRMPKIAADTVFNLLHNKWSTNVSKAADASTEQYDFNGYYGDYTVKVNFGGEWREFTLPAHKMNEDSVFVLEYAEGIPALANILEARFTSDASGIELVFDRAMDFSTFSPQDFNVYSLKDFTISSFDEQDSVTVFLNMEGLTVNPGQYYAIYYDGDTAKAKSTSLLNRFGPMEIENQFPAFLKAESDTLGQKIHVVFSDTMEDPVSADGFSLTVNGSQANITSIEYDETDSRVLIFTIADAFDYEAEVRLTYTEGTYQSIDGYKLFSFGPKYVENNVPNPVIPDAIEGHQAPGIAVYPNPVENILSIDNITGVAEIRIYDAQGRLVSSRQTNNVNSMELDLSDISIGTFYIQLVDVSGNIVENRKLVKN